MRPFNIYKKLFKYFGPQGWWPIFDKKFQKCIYHNCRGRDNYRDVSRNAFEICVGAILTQNTAWKNVEKTLANLYSHLCEKHPYDPPFSKKRAKGDLSPQFILSSKNLEQLIQPAGYYNQKAKKLRIFAKWWQSSIYKITTIKKNVFDTPTKKVRPHFFCGGKILEFRQELLSLWGIGPETADSILLYALNKPIFVIDAYTRRLCKEFGIEFKTYDEYRQFFESQLPKSVKLFNEYHALIVAWGKLHAKDPSAAIKIIK